MIAKIKLDVSELDDELYDALLEAFSSKAQEMGVEPTRLDDWSIECVARVE